MSTDNDPDDAVQMALSSLMDGELPTDFSVGSLSTHWRNDEHARASWHAYHLIGDVLRSDDLASSPGHDGAFMQGLRSKLACEPIPLAPAARPTADADPAVDTLVHAPPVRCNWFNKVSAPVAVAAGFAVVAVLMLFGQGLNLGLGLQRPEMAATQLPAAVPTEVVRNARLDRYLAAHRSMAGGLVEAANVGQHVQLVYETK